MTSKRWIQSVARVLLALMLLNHAGLIVALAETAQDKTVLYGTVPGNQVWKDRVYLIGDVTIPENVTVTVEAGTRIAFASYDILAAGSDPHQCEIIAYGTLDVQSTPDNPVLISALPESALRVLPIDKNTRIVRFTPYKIETENLRKEFRSFKIQYLVLWSLIYGMWILRR